MAKQNVTFPYTLPRASNYKISNTIFGLVAFPCIDYLNQGKHEYSLLI